MYNNLVVGAGQIGSRHLQSILKLEINQIIYILDPSIDSLDIAKERANEIPNNHKLFFVSNWSSVPKNLDFVIVSTSSNVREEVITKLINNCKVKYLILEKILFQDPDAFERASMLISKHKVKTWVNFPLRAKECFKDLKNTLNSKKSITNFQAVGSSWGLGCNSVHYIDLFEFLSNSRVIDLNFDFVDNKIFESKRKGFFEFTGTINGKMENNSSFHISSLDGKNSDVSIFIANDENRYVFNDGNKSFLLNVNSNEISKLNLKNYDSQYQSDMTGQYFLDIIYKGDCDLVKYDDTKSTQILFTKGLLNKYNSITGSINYKCPIT